MIHQRSGETHRRILEAAKRTFAQHGYNGTGVAEICEAAGVSKGAFYHHFPSKQAVFLELLQDWLRGLEAGLNDTRQEIQPVPQTLLEMSGAMRQVFQTAGGQLPIFLEFWIQASRDPAFWQATIAPYHRFQSFFRSMVEAGIEEGSLKPVDAETAANVIISLAVGVLFQGLLDPSGADWEKVTREGMQFLMAGLARGET